MKALYNRREGSSWINLFQYLKINFHLWKTNGKWPVSCKIIRLEAVLLTPMVFLRCVSCIFSCSSHFLNVWLWFRSSCTCDWSPPEAWLSWTVPRKSCSCNPCDTPHTSHPYRRIGLTRVWNRLHIVFGSCTLKLLQREYRECNALFAEAVSVSAQCFASFFLVCKVIPRSLYSCATSITWPL